MTDRDNVAVSIKNLSVRYEDKLVLSDVSFDVEEGDFVGIIGPNGGGKTTLIKAILGLAPVVSGEVYVYGQTIKKAKKMIGYVPQTTSFDRKFPITVREVVLTGMLKPKLSLFHSYSSGDMEKADSMLEKVGIYSLKDRLVSELSGGEFQKMTIARALATEPKILMLDEPTASVDANSKNQIFSLLNNLNSDITVMMVTHDLAAVSSYVKSLACINKELFYHGDTELSEEVVGKLYGCPIDLIAHGLPHRVLREHEEVE